MRHRVGMAPVIKRMHTEKRGNEKGRHIREGHHDRLGDPADHHTPPRADQMVKHGEEERAQTERSPKDECRQIGMEKPVVVNHPADNRQHQADSGDHQHARPEIAGIA